MKKFLCLGSATRDIFVSLRETRLIDNSQEIIAQKLMAFEFGAKEYAESFQEEVGGSALNVAVGLTKLGQKGFLLSRVDRGDWGRWILKKAGNNHVKKNYVQKIGGTKQGEVSIIISDQKNKDHIILRCGDSTDTFNWNKFVQKFKEKADWLVVASQKIDWQEKKEAILSFIKKRKIKLAFNPSSYQISRAQEELAGFWPSVNWLFLNKDEAIELVKKIEQKELLETEELLKRILSWGVQGVALTDGQTGAWAANTKEGYFCPAMPVKDIVETVGAGDAFLAGFLAVFCQEENIKSALASGIANSAGVVKKVGAIQGLLTVKELKKVLGEILKRVKKIY